MWTCIHIYIHVHTNILNKSSASSYVSVPHLGHNFNIFYYIWFSGSVTFEANLLWATINRTRLRWST